MTRLTPIESDCLHLLQRLTFPSAMVDGRASLYARSPPGEDLFVDASGVLALPKGRVADFSTYFNSFSLAKWRGVTELDQVAVRVSGTGRATVRVVCYDAAARSHEIARTGCDLSTFDRLALPSLNEVDGTILALEVEALESGVELTGGEWVTPEPPSREVALAIVITTFNREDAIQDAFVRITALLDRVDTNKLHLFIVNNGKSIRSLGPHPCATLIPNRNLGGAGGFTRGLLEVIDARKFTHCLFMDDDASCEVESIVLTHALLGRLKDPKASVAGAMLLHARPCIQAEKGAIVAIDEQLPWYFVALNQQKDVGQLEHVVDNDGPDRANYGGWWFFAFPLAAIGVLPFPFFVRGDDIDFSLVNSLPIVTMNGISTWCEAFAIKLAAPVEFLACRAWFAVLLKHGTTPAVRKNLRRVLVYAFGFGVRYDYATLEAALTGLEFSMGGPEAFATDPAPLAWLQQVRESVRYEPVEAGMIEQARLHDAAIGGRWTALVARLTLGGQLLPGSSSCGITYSPDGYAFGLSAPIRSKRLMWKEGDKLVCARRDRWRMVRATARWLRLYFLSERKLQKLAEVWRSQAGQFQTREYWDAELQKTDKQNAKTK